MANPPPDEVPEIARAAIKLSNFWPENVRMWFARAETQFRMANVTRSLTKFDYLISALSQDELTRVSDLILDPPENEPYERLRDALIAAFAESDNARYKKYFRELTLGDKRPSDLLCQMKQLCPEISDPILKTQWLDRLPATMSAILVAAPGDVKDLGKTADVIHEQMRCGEVSAVTRADDLPRVLGELTRRLERLEFQRSQPHRRSSRSRSRSRGRPGTRHEGAVCYYHRRFGEAARRCRRPCAFVAVGDAVNPKNAQGRPLQ